MASWIRFPCRLVATAGDSVTVLGHVLPNFLRFIGYVLIPVLKSEACIETSELLPAKPAHLSQVSRGQPSLSDQVGDDGFELVEVTT
jgi:hypothetical protein